MQFNHRDTEKAEINAAKAANATLKYSQISSHSSISSTGLPTVAVQIVVNVENIAIVRKVIVGNVVTVVSVGCDILCRRCRRRRRTT